jgi:hypothetical protein
MLRLGRHGSLCFLCDDRAAIVAISDVLHRKDAVRFEEVHVPGEAGDSPGRRSSRYAFETRGPSFARQFGRVRRYEELDRRIAELGVTCRLDAAGFEQDYRTEHVPRRDLHYHELDHPGAAVLELSFVLDAPFRWLVHCPGLRTEGRAFLLPGGVRAWVSATHPVHTEGDRLWTDFPEGTHSVVLVVMSRRSGIELHDAALIVRPEDAVLAAVAQASVPSRLLPTLPVESEADLRDAGAVLAELDIGRAVVVDGLARWADALGLGAGGVVVLASGEPGWHRALLVGLDADAVPRDPPLAANRGADVARALFEELTRARGSRPPGPGAVVCDSTRPCVRVIAAAYAALGGYTLELLDVGEEPVAPPDWSLSHPEPLAIRIERYRVALAEQVNRVIAPQLTGPVPPIAVAFTRGFAYSLLRGGTGPWAGEVALGVLPEKHAPTLLVRAFAHGSAPGRKCGVALVVDALSDAGHATEFDRVRASVSATVAYPVGLAGPDAIARNLRDAAETLPVDLVTLICHGERDFIELASGSLTAAQLSDWRLPSSPVIVNNSCGSWDSTGAAFLTAGARAYVGTLWPVTTGPAARVSAALVEALTSSGEIYAGLALRRALSDAAELEYDDRYAYALVGLPTVPARLAPLVDDAQRAEIAEHGLADAYDAALRLVDSGQHDSALWLRSNVIAALRDDLSATLSADDFGGHLEVHNAPGGYLDAIVASYDANLWTRLATARGVTPDRAISGHEHAVAAWEAALEKFIRPPMGVTEGPGAAADTGTRSV